MVAIFSSCAIQFLDACSAHCRGSQVTQTRPHQATFWSYGRSSTRSLRGCVCESAFRCTAPTGSADVDDACPWLVVGCFCCTAAAAAADAYPRCESARERDQPTSGDPALVVVAMSGGRIAGPVRCTVNLCVLSTVVLDFFLAAFFFFFSF